MVTALYILAGLLTFVGAGLGLAALAQAHHLRKTADAMRFARPAIAIAQAVPRATVHVVGKVVSAAEQQVPTTGDAATLVIEVLLLQGDNVGLSSKRLRVDRSGDSMVIDDGTGRALLDLRHVTLLARSSEHRGQSAYLPAAGRAMVTRTTAKPDAPYVYQEHWVCAGDEVHVEGVVMETELPGAAGAYRDASAPRISLAGTETAPLRVVSRNLDEMKRSADTLLLTGAALLCGGPVLFLITWLASD